MHPKANREIHFCHDFRDFVKYLKSRKKVEKKQFLLAGPTSEEVKIDYLE